MHGNFSITPPASWLFSYFVVVVWWAWWSGSRWSGPRQHSYHLVPRSMQGYPYWSQTALLALHY